MNHHDKDSIFYITPHGGLGNRILMMIAAIRFINKKYYTYCKVNWHKTDELNASYDEIFEQPHQHIIEGQPTNSYTYNLQNNLEPTIEHIDGININHYACFRSVLDDQTANLEGEYRQAAKSLRFKQYYYNIADTIDIKDRIGIHCRRTDFWTQNHEEAARTHVRLDKQFIKYLNTTHQNEKFFIATDSPYTLINFEDNINNIIHYPKTEYPLWRTRSSNCIKEAIIDHILLSRCKKIIADSNSTFSLTASWLGRIRKEPWKL